MNLLKVAIFGATGYVGLELVKILSKHKRVKIIYLCASSSVGKSINLFDTHPWEWESECGLPKIFVKNGIISL